MSRQNMEAFRVGPNAMGIDLLRSQIKTNLGTHVANATTTFEAGMSVELNSSQEIIKSTGVTIFGIAKYNKATSLHAMIVGEAVVLNGTTASSLAHANLLQPTGAATGLGVRVATAEMTGTVYTEGVGNDYNMNYTTGTIARDAASTIVDGATVYVNYSWQLGEADYQFEGENFWNRKDDVTVQDSRISVITDWSTIFTTMYDPSETYAINDQIVSGKTANGLAGYFTKGAKGTAAVGRVMQIPSSDDPFLGIRFVGGMTS